MNQLSDVQIHDKLEEIIKRRNIDLSEKVKFRGLLKTTKWNHFEAALKSDALVKWK